MKKTGANASIKTAHINEITLDHHIFHLRRPRVISLKS